MYGRFLPFKTLLTDGSSVCNEKREVVRLSSAAEWMWSPHHRLSAGVEGLGSRGRHFVWRLLNYKDGRHGWQSWVISLRVTAWSHFHNSSLPTISGHNVNTASSSVCLGGLQPHLHSHSGQNKQLLPGVASAQYWITVPRKCAKTIRDC